MSGLNHRTCAEDRDTKDERRKAGIPGRIKRKRQTKDRTRIRRKRRKIGLVPTGREDGRRRPIPKIAAEKDDEKTTTT